MTIDPAVVCLIVIATELLFMVAAVHKLRDLRRFAEVFAAYGVVPRAVGRRIAPVIPALELAVAVGLLFENLRSFALLLAVALLLAYAIAIAVNLVRGRRDLDCGCAGPNNRRPIGGWMVWRNIGMAACVAAGILPVSGRSLELTDVVTVGCGTLGCVLVYLCLDRLLAPARRITQ